MSSTDILLFESQLTDEELIIQKSANDYCQSKLMPRILEANRNEVFDKSIYTPQLEKEIKINWKKPWEIDKNKYKHNIFLASLGSIGSIRFPR